MIPREVVDVRAERERVLRKRAEAREQQQQLREAGLHQRHLDPATTAVADPRHPDPLKKKRAKKKAPIVFASAAVKNRKEKTSNGQAEGTESGADPGGNAVATAPNVERNHGIGTLPGQQPKAKDMRHRMTNLEYDQLRDALRTMRAEDPELTPPAALEKVNQKLGKPMSLAAFYYHWAAAKPKRRAAAKPKRRAVTKSEVDQVRAIVPAEGVPVPTPAKNGRGASKIRLVMVEAELGQGDIEQIARAFSELVAQRT